MRRVKRCFWGVILLLVSFLFPSSLLAQGSAEVKVVMDFLNSFGSATLSKPIVDVSLRQSICGEISSPSLFQHPVVGTQPSTVSYQLELPRSTGSQKLFLVTDTGLGDGIQWEQSDADGVRFLIRINNQVVLDQHVTESKWIHHCIDLNSFQNRKIKVDFVTLPGKNTAYDWASWGEPRILLFNNSIPIQNDKIPLNAGVIAFQHDSTQPLSIKLASDDGIQVKHWNYSPGENVKSGNRWDVMEYDFDDVLSTSLKFDPPSLVRSTIIGYYTPDISLDYITPAQALVTPNSLLPLRFKVTNKGKGKLVKGTAQVVAYDASGNPIGAGSIPELKTDNSWIGDIMWTTPARTGPTFITGKLLVSDSRSGLSSNSSAIRISTTAEQSRSASIDIIPVDMTSSQGSRWLDNGKVKIVFLRHQTGIHYAKIYSRKGDGWEQVALWKPLIQVNLNTPHGPVTWEPSFTQVFRGRNLDSSERYTNSWQFSSPLRDSENNLWNIGLNVTLDNENPELDITYTWSSSGSPSVHSLLGPNIYVGEGTFGGSKTSGLFPGLEYLYGAEASSSPRDFAAKLADRRSPDSTKITIPLMAISWGETNQVPVLNPERFFCPDSIKDYWSVGNQPQKTFSLYWNIFQKWDGVHGMPTPRFSSPNFDQGMNNHRLALFLPSIPDYFPENQDYSYSWTLEPNKVYSLNAQVAITDGPVLSSVRHYLKKNNGLPSVNAWPRTPAQQRELSRIGFDSVWDGTNKWAHCIDWPYSPAPGLAALLWNDVLSDPTLASERLPWKPFEGKVAEIIEERIQPMVDGILSSDKTGSSLSSSAQCHIMLWEFPFHYGYLEAAWNTVDQQVQRLIASQKPNGSWLFKPVQAQQKTLGQSGDATMGTTAHNAMILLRHARITGSSASRDAGLNALGFIGQFYVPRGGQVWECPLYQPDILPAAYTIGACVDAWRLTGNLDHIDHAVRWAESGIPFIYLWSLPNKPMMLGSTIPVFGSTFYTHTWLAVPVQWNGLVYSYHLIHLAETMEKIASGGTTLPQGVLGFTPNDWRSIQAHILASATHQQCVEGNLIGTYPDSISNFEKRNGAFINPEDILLNQLALEGFDPDIHSIILRKDQSDYTVLSTAATILHAASNSQKSDLVLKYYTGCTIYAMITNVAQKPEVVKVDGTVLLYSEDTITKQPGWHYNNEKKCVYLAVPNLKGTASIEIK